MPATDRQALPAADRPPDPRRQTPAEFLTIAYADLRLAVQIRRPDKAAGDLEALIAACHESDVRPLITEGLSNSYVSVRAGNLDVADACLRALAERYQIPWSPIFQVAEGYPLALEASGRERSPDE